MASNPPFQVEDQTDKDFFDKLVHDEFGPTTTGSNPQFTDHGNDSEDVKAFANLNIGEVGNAFGDLGGGGDDSMLEFEAKTEKDRMDGATESLGAYAEEMNSLVSSNSVGCDSIVESSNDGIGSEFTSDLTMSKSNVSGLSGVKQVGWNSFHTDSELKVTSSGTKGTSVGCKSACEAFGQPQYCCSGAYATPDVCKPSTYSQIFKSACLQAYSYTYDDRTSTFTCASADYMITFCPTPNTSTRFC